MGGFSVRTQSFSVYQAIDWICNKNASLSNKINGVRRIREIFEKKPNNDLIKLGVASRLIELLQDTFDNLLQSEIVWTLANIAAGKSQQTEIVLRKGLSIFLELLDDNFCPPEIQSDVVWALANIAGDCAGFRDQLLNSGVMERTLDLLTTPATYELEKNCVWLLSNLCRHKEPLPDFEIISRCIPFLSYYLYNGMPEIIEHVCWALKYIADGPSDQIEAIINSGLCERLVEIAGSECTSNIVNALLVLINISSGTSEQTQVLVEAGIIPVLSKLLDTSIDNQVLKNTSFVIANLVIDGVYNNRLTDEEVFGKFAKMFKICDEPTQIEILHAINNATVYGDREKMLHLEDVGCHDVLCYALKSASSSLAVRISLEAIWNISLMQIESQKPLTIINKVYSSVVKFQDDEDEQISSMAKSLEDLL